MYAPVQNFPTKILDNPRTIRATDFTWFNTRGGEIIQSDYNKCNQMVTRQSVSYVPSKPSHTVPYNCLPRYLWYPNSFKEDCICNLKGEKCRHVCKFWNGTYVNPN